MNKSNSGNSIEKRAKELDCLYAFSSLVVKNNITVDEILQGTIDLIPPASQYPEITSARIILEDQTYKTKNFKESIRKRTSDIVVHDKPRGTLEVCLFNNLEKFYIEEALKMARGNEIKAAKLLNINYHTFRYRRKKRSRSRLET